MYAGVLTVGGERWPGGRGMYWSVWGGTVGCAA